MQALEQAAAFLQRASTRYHESGHPDTAGQVLIKAAKWGKVSDIDSGSVRLIFSLSLSLSLSLSTHRLVETVKPYQSAQYYLATAEIHEIEEKYRDAAKAIRSALNMYSRAREWVVLSDVSVCVCRCVCLCVWVCVCVCVCVCGILKSTVLRNCEGNFGCVFTLVFVLWKLLSLVLYGFWKKAIST